MSDGNAAKAALRSTALARRDGLDETDREAWSEIVALRALALLDGVDYRYLSSFLPIQSEIDPQPIMAAARAAGHETALPAFEADGLMVFRAYHEHTRLDPAGFGTRSPAPEAPVVAPEVILMPLAAFDRTGARIGYGKGHYDRAIAGLRTAGHDPLLIGLAFSVQEVPDIPTEPHDVALDVLITETEVIDFRKG